MHEVVLEVDGVTVARDDDEKLVPKAPPVVTLELPRTEHGGLLLLLTIDELKEDGKLPVPVGPKVEVVFLIS